jgi:hypothetical protein
MTWPDWSKADERGLARYVTDEANRILRFGENQIEPPPRPGDRKALLQDLYQRLLTLRIQYTPERYTTSNDERQYIRTPEEILVAPRQGTCLDLAALYCGICLGNELLPLLVVLAGRDGRPGHAFVVVALDHGLRDWDAWPVVSQREQDHFTNGLLADSEPLRQRVEAQEYVAIECTGFAWADELPPTVPEGQRRLGGTLTFDGALKAAARHLDPLQLQQRPFQFALDIATLQRRWGFAPHQSSGPDYAGVEIDLREKAIIQTYSRTLVGRERELEELDRFRSESPCGLLLVTAPAGFGKSSLLAAWLDTRRSTSQFVAYHFFSRQYEATTALAGAYRHLLRQLERYHGQRFPLGDNPRDTVYGVLATRLPRPDRPLVLVLDGLDEAEAPFSPPFPSPLPEGLYVIASVRADRDQVPEPIREWVGLGRRLHLERLSRETIAEWLRQVDAGKLAAYADDPEFVAQLDAVTAGFPLYLRYLLEE